jgi:hypothetical protein
MAADTAGAVLNAPPQREETEEERTARLEALERRAERDARSAAPTRIVYSEQLIDLIPNSTYSGKSESGTKFDVYSRQDGRMSGRTARGSFDEGTWEITSDGKYCRQWNKWRDASRDCFYVYLIEHDTFRFKAIGKSFESVGRIFPGDPEQLAREISTPEGAPLQLTAIAASSAAVSETTAPPEHVSEEAARPERLGVAILPVAKPRHLNWWDDDAFIQSGRKLVSGRPNLHLAYSYGSRGPEKDLSIRPGAVWKGDNFRQVPDRLGVFALKDRFDVDIALGFYSAPKKAGADADSADRYRVEIYIFDLEFQRMYQGRGDERDYKKVTARLFDELLEDRSRTEGKGT